MQSYNNPLFLSDTLQNVLVRLSKTNLLNSRVVCHKWREVANTILEQELITKFGLSKKCIFSLKSRNLVFQRLSKLYNRGKNEFLNEHGLYQLYCAGGTVNENFVHLLDDNEDWFKQYFSMSDPFFLACNLRYACLIGNLNLVKHLVEKKGCELSSIHAELAIASGELDLVKYLFDIKQCDETKPGIFKIHYYRDQAICSGDVAVLSYIIEKFNIRPTDHNFSVAVFSQSCEMVKFLHKNCELTLKTIGLFEFVHSRNLAIIKYFMEILKWTPQDQYHNIGTRTHITGAEGLLEIAYAMGMIEIVNYVEAAFPKQPAKIEFLDKVVRSGNVDCLKHLLSLLGIPTESMKLTGAKYCLLEEALNSGKLDMFEFVVNTFSINPKEYHDFVCAVKSSNVKLVRHVMDVCGYKITDKELVAAWETGNLELISMVFNQADEQSCQILDNFFVRFNYSSLMLAYHLVNTDILSIASKKLILEKAYFCLRHFKDKDTDLMLLFIKYLVEVQQVKPTDNMITDVIRKHDQKMLTFFLQGRKLIEQREDKSEASGKKNDGCFLS